MTVGNMVLASFLFAAVSAEAAALNEIYVDFAVKAETPPVLDGKLDDPAWKDAIVHTRFYEYFKPHPKKAAIRSEMRLLYTDKALWISNHTDRSGLHPHREQPGSYPDSGMLRYARFAK